MPDRRRGLLGKQPALRDARTLKLRNYVQRPRLLPPPPTSQDWSAGIKAWGMMLNGPNDGSQNGVPKDGLGDCVIAAMGHAEQSVTAVASGNEVTVPDSVILQGYEAVGHYSPGDPSTDGGCVELEAMRWWQQTGLGGHRIRAYAECALSNHDDVKDCINLFGFVFIGFNVPAYAMDQFDAGQPWDIDPHGQSEIVGGHGVIGLKYDPRGVYVISWGEVQLMTWAFWDQFVDEAYGVMTDEWLRTNGTSPSLLNADQLLADVQQLKDAPGPSGSVSLRLVADPVAVVAGGRVQLVVTVQGGAGTPTGTVTFARDGVSLGHANLVRGAAHHVYHAHKLGAHTITATYGGDAQNAGGVSASVAVTVSAQPGDGPVIDPNISGWLAWEQQVGNFLVGAYAAGNVADAVTWQDQLANTAPTVAALLRGDGGEIGSPPALPQRHGEGG